MSFKSNVAAALILSGVFGVTQAQGFGDLLKKGMEEMQKKNQPAPNPQSAPAPVQQAPAAAPAPAPVQAKAAPEDAFKPCLASDYIIFRCEIGSKVLAFCSNFATEESNVAFSYGEKGAQPPEVYSEITAASKSKISVASHTEGRATYSTLTHVVPKGLTYSLTECSGTACGLDTRAWLTITKGKDIQPGGGFCKSETIDSKMENVYTEDAKGRVKVSDKDFYTVAKQPYPNHMIGNNHIPQ